MIPVLPPVFPLPVTHPSSVLNPHSPQPSFFSGAETDVQRFQKSIAAVQDALDRLGRAAAQDRDRSPQGIGVAASAPRTLMKVFLPKDLGHITLCPRRIPDVRSIKAELAEKLHRQGKLDHEITHNRVLMGGLHPQQQQQQESTPVAASSAHAAELDDGLSSPEAIQRAKSLGAVAPDGSFVAFVLTLAPHGVLPSVVPSRRPVRQDVEDDADDVPITPPPIHPSPPVEAPPVLRPPSGPMPVPVAPESPPPAAPHPPQPEAKEGDDPFALQLVTAAGEGRLDELENLLRDRPGDLNSRAEGVTALIRACARGQTGSIKLLLEFQADPEYQDETDGGSALLHLCSASENMHPTEALGEWRICLCTRCPPLGCVLSSSHFSSVVMVSVLRFLPHSSRMQD